jgi:hypothetical protein
MGRRIGLALGALVALVLVVLAGLWVLGKGWLGDVWHGGIPAARAVAPAVVAERAAEIQEAATAMGVSEPKQILFGDLHVHTTFSGDAFQMALPMAGGDGAHPVADACDFARHCAALDFWSINDHDLTLTPERWKETIAAIRQCNAIAGEAARPDMVSFLGWEWTQVGSTPENHFGHKNVVLLDLEDGKIPTRPIAAGAPPGSRGIADELGPPAVLMGLAAALTLGSGGPDLARYFADTGAVPACKSGAAVRELPDDCREFAATPGELFAKLDDWNHAAIVIPHGTTWGMYTPPGSAWDKQLTPGQHDPDRQRLVEVFSGHGNSEEYRPWREVVIDPDGARRCPEPSADHLPSCWRAGEIIAEHCRTAGGTVEECDRRAATAREDFVAADRNGGAATVGVTTVPEWQDAGQCRDCFQPAFNYRPRSSVQYMMALGRPGQQPDHFRFGFIGSSDNHSGRPGTGYKEVARTEFTEARFGNFTRTPLGYTPDREPRAESKRFDPNASESPFTFWETERGASFFLNGGLAAVHATGRDRKSIWDALQRREVYGTSGPRILLWFDLLNSPAGRAPMGSEVAMAAAPLFEVRAVGSFEQLPGCPEDATGALAPERLDRLCQGECYNPSDARRPISRIEVVRIRPQQRADEPVDGLVEDPWRVFACPADPAGCRATFSDEDFAGSGRGALYYVRAVESPSAAVGANPLHCKRDAGGRCVEMNPCFGRANDDDCLAETEERAWSSPIFVDPASAPGSPP